MTIKTIITKTQTKSRDMKVNLHGGFTYKAVYKIKEDAYTKLLSTAEKFGNDYTSRSLGLYLANQIYPLKGINKNAQLILKNSTISCTTHFPSTYVTITVCVTDCEAEIDPCYDKYEEVKTTLDDAFRWRFDILDFFRGELDAPVIRNKE